MATCSILGCGRKKIARGVCNKHYLDLYQTSRTPKSITRDQLAQEISELTGLEFKKARRILRIVLKSISDSLRKGEQVYIRGFGTFQYNPLSSHYGPRFSFRPGRALHYMINEDYKGPPDEVSKG